MAITLHQYQKWLDGCPGEDNPLRHIAQDKFSCYIDYKYMNDVFESRPDILKVLLCTDRETVLPKMIHKITCLFATNNVIISIVSQSNKKPLTTMYICL